MRTERVVTNLRCNQSCTYCNSRAPTDDLRVIAPASIRRVVDRAVAKGVEEVVLTGGEPTLRRDLAEIVSYARSRGITKVCLETNATTIDAAGAAALFEAGLTLARVNLSGWGARIDETTRDKGGFDRTLAGLRALLAAGIRVEISVALVRSTLFEIEMLPDRIAEAGLAIRALVVVIPTDGPDPDELISYEAAAAALLALDARARPRGMSVRFANNAGFPPCVLPPQRRSTHLFALTLGGRDREGSTRIEACRGCQVEDRCPGFSKAQLARFGTPRMHPIDEERTRRRLSMVSTVEEQIARELVSSSLDRTPAGDVYEEVVRVNFHCNQTCRFCFVSTHLPTAEHEAVIGAIRAAAAKGSKIVLSGGEPTLNPRLVEYVKLARSLTSKPIRLQTNAVRLEDAERVREVEAAGVSEAFVSLHGSTAEISDVVTGAPGTFEKTVRGLDNLHESSIAVTVNFVICEANRENLPAYVRFVAARWPKAAVTISFVAPGAEVVPRDADMIPRYSAVLPALAEALREGERLGVTIGGFDSMCGIPLCLVPEDLRRKLDLSELPVGLGATEFAKTPTCVSCALERRCYGIRRGYAELHGTGELRAVSA